METAKPLPQTAPSQIQLVAPIYNEGENVVRLYNQLVQAKLPFDSLKYVYDFNEDTSLPHIAKLSAQDPRVKAEKNEYGRGVINALRWGFAQAGDGPVILTMGDNSDDLSILPEMIRLWREGATVVCPSRYMKGGKKIGGGFVKSWMSRLAGTSLKVIGFPTSDATNNFRLYDGAWLRQQKIESVGGFEVGLELCYKAFAQKKTIKEWPTVWTDRVEGQSRFKVLAWTPRYLKWYFKTLKTILLQP